jgi:hypothetical protein
MSLRARSRATAKKKAEIEVKKIANAANRAVNKTAKEAAAAAKKNNRKDKKVGHSAVIDEAEKAIELLLQDIDYGEPNEVEIQLVAELEVINVSEGDFSQTRILAM